jgi:hypothetical protein
MPFPLHPSHTRSIEDVWVGERHVLDRSQVIAYQSHRLEWRPGGLLVLESA